MPLPNETIKSIRKYAIKNAIDYGKAQTPNVLGKVIRSVPKEQIGELKLEVEKIIKEVNFLSKPQLEKEYKKYEDEFDAQYERKLRRHQNLE